MSKYWRTLLIKAWIKTRDLLPWSKQSVVGHVIGVISWLATAIAAVLINHIVGLAPAIIAVAVVVTAIFLWLVVMTQAEMYAELDAEIERSRDLVPDYDKWRHRPTLTLREAAHLWSEQRPRASLAGTAKDTYEMLCGAIHKGELDFEAPKGSHLQSVNKRYFQANPNPDLIVTRTALRSFAEKYDYEPRFLQEP